jgi:putative transposase
LIVDEWLCRGIIRGLALSRQLLCVTDGRSGLLKALGKRFGKKLAPQRGVIHTSRNLQRPLAKRYRNEAHRKLITALEQACDAKARQMRLKLEAWRRIRSWKPAKNG